MKIENVLYLSTFYVKESLSLNIELHGYFLYQQQ